MSTTENIDRLISLLIAKRDGKKIERHCDKCGPDYRCAVCRGWEDFEMLTLAFHPNHYRIALYPEPKQKETKMKNRHIIVGENNKCLCGMFEGKALFCADIIASIDTIKKHGQSWDGGFLARLLGSMVKDMDKEPAPTHQTVCAHCKEVIQPGTCHISWGTPEKHEICISQTIIGRDWTPAGVEEGK